MLLTIQDRGMITYKRRVTPNQAENIEKLLSVESTVKDYGEAMNKICMRFSVVADSLYEKSRDMNIIKARALLFYYMVNRLGYTLHAAGAEFKKHHATVLHATRIAEKNLMSAYNELFKTK